MWPRWWAFWTIPRNLNALAAAPSMTTPGQGQEHFRHSCFAWRRTTRSRRRSIIAFARLVRFVHGCMASRRFISRTRFRYDQYCPWLEVPSTRLHGGWTRSLNRFWKSTQNVWWKIPSPSVKSSANVNLAKDRSCALSILRACSQTSHLKRRSASALTRFIDLLTLPGPTWRWRESPQEAAHQVHPGSGILL